MSIRIATVIRENREAKGLTQEQLAELIGRSTGYVGQLERGLTFPSMPILAKLVDVLGIDANTLFYEDIRKHTFKEITIRISRLSKEKQEFVLSFVNLLEHSFEEGVDSENRHL